MEPLLSFIVPVYNQKRAYLEQCVAAFQANAGADWEVLLVDDGSSAEEAAFLDFLCAGDDRLRCIHQANAGVAAARNNGLREARGTWVTFPDSDDWIADDYVSSIRPLLTDGTDLVLFDITQLNGAGQQPRQLFPCKAAPASASAAPASPSSSATASAAPASPSSSATASAALTPAEVKAFFLKLFTGDTVSDPAPDGTFQVWSKVYRKEQIPGQAEASTEAAAPGPFHEELSIAEDIVFNLQYLNAVQGGVTYLNRPLYFRRIHDESAMHSYNPGILENDRRFIAELQKIADDNPFASADELAECFRIRALYCLVGVIHYDMLHPDSPDGLGTRIRKLRRLAGTEPYRTAIRRCNKDELPVYYQRFLTLFRLHLSWLFPLRMKLQGKI